MLSFALPLLLTGSGWAQTAQTPPAGLNTTGCIDQLNDEGAVKCLTEAIKTAGDTEVLAKILREIEQIQKEKVSVKIIKALREELKAEDNPNFLSNIVIALGEIEPIKEETVKLIIDKALKVKEDDVRYSANFALRKAFNKITSQGVLERVTKDLGDLLNKEYDWEVRLEAAAVLGSSGLDVKSAVSELADLLQDKDEEVCRNAIGALNFIATELRGKALTRDRRENAKEGLDEAIKTLEKLNKDLQDIGDPKKVIAALRETKKSLTVYDKSLLDKATLFVVLFIGIILVYIVVFLVVFWRSPLFMLTANKWLRGDAEIKFSISMVSLTIPINYLSLVVFVKHHPRVLDAWVAANIKNARNKLERKQKVKKRYVYVPVPVAMDDTELANFTAKNLKPKFDRGRECILIWGEEGSGKTSLACQLEKWAMSENPEERLCEHKMLPILLEQEDFQVTEVFIEAIRRSLRNLINSQDISEKLLEQLLRRQRLLVIVDGFSEMSEDTRKQIHADFPVNALVVTSRSKEKLGGVNPTELKPTMKELFDPAVYPYAKAIAWQCLQQTYRPAAAKRDDVLAALEGDDAEERLDYLENHLHLIETIEPAQDKIRFALDTQAEYLAALRMVELYGDDKQSWRDFFAKADAMPDAPGNIEGFLLAVRDCCQSQSKEVGFPDFVWEELSKRSKRINLDSAA
ncbi:MAG: NACHT domain-containing protein [Oscillatoria sp. SIO1A7]|nr:NACHT domain-containing protein [Oscillatoria sp. SIO1A7]